jgi:hypothetical protein
MANLAFVVQEEGIRCPEGLPSEDPERPWGVSIVEQYVRDSIAADCGAKGLQQRIEARLVWHRRQSLLRLRLAA